MSAALHLPAGAEQTAYRQGWDDESIVIHLAGFVASRGLDAELTQYLADVAAEEESEAAQARIESDLGNDVEE